MPTDFVNHVRGNHNIDVKNGHSHWAHCNECLRSNDHGKRIDSLEYLLDHLFEVHSLYAYIVE